MLLAILAALTELGPVGVRSWSGNGLGAVAARALVLPLSCRAHSRPGGCPVAPRQCGRATDDGDKESTAGGFAPCSSPRATSIGRARSGWRAWAAAAPVPRLLAKRWTIPAHDPLLPRRRLPERIGSAPQRLARLKEAVLERLCRVLQPAMAAPGILG